MNDILTLNNIIPGQRAKILYLNTRGSMRRRLLDIGLVENAPIECVGQSPHGDPKAFLIRGAVIAIRSEDAAEIVVSNRVSEGEFSKGDDYGAN